MAATTTAATAARPISTRYRGRRALRPRSWANTLAQTSNWLSAVDIIADITAATRMPATTAGNTAPAVAKKTCSGSATSGTSSRANSPSSAMPNQTRTYQTAVITVA